MKSRETRDFLSANWNHCVIRKALILLYQHGGSVVECLTRDPRVQASRKAHWHCILSLILCLVLVQPRKTGSDMTEKLLTGM